MSDDGVTCNGCEQMWPRDPVLEVSCPTCSAGTGQKCRRPSEHAGGFVHPHVDRDRLAMQQVEGYGTCPASSTQEPDSATDDQPDTDSVAETQSTQTTFSELA